MTKNYLGKLKTVLTVVAMLSVAVSCKKDSANEQVGANQTNETQTSEIQSSGAKELNELGLAKYKEKNYIEAAKLFEKAIAIDPKYARATYNAASMYAVMTDDCGEYFEEALKNLKKAVSLNAQYKKTAQNDSDWKRYKADYNFAKITGLVETDESILNYLHTQHKVTQCHNQGAFSYCETYTFAKDGKVTIHSEKPVENGKTGEIENLETTITGTYKIDHGTLYVTPEGEQPQETSLNRIFNIVQDCSA